jgi:hypothetical protein
MKWTSWVNVLLGAWLFVAPWVLAYRGIGAAEDHAAGIVVLLLALGSAMVPKAVDALAIMNVIAGLWILFAPAILGYDFIRIAATNDIGVGLLVVLLAALRAGTARLLPGRKIMS